jgi:3',5'-cyclic AMP phosphodiesterase CpdA
MTVLLQVSDPHFGTEQPPVVEALVRLVEAEKPDVLVLSGDITQRATRTQFERARSFLERLRIPVKLIIPGNHDLPLYNLPARMSQPYANHQRCFGPDLEPEHASAEVLVLTVNTTRAWRHKDGEVSRTQVERVARRLRLATPGQLRVVVTHQPVAVTRTEDEPNLLHGRVRAIERWAEAGADLILGGHIHLPFVVALHERRATLRRRVWAVQAGTALSSRVRFGADCSVNLLRWPHDPVGGRACRIERWDFGREQQAFAPVSDQRLALGPLHDE